jgi:predicted phage tail component-like protein
MANSFSFDGTDMAGASYSLTLQREAVPMIAPLDVASYNVPYAYGGYVYGTNVQPLSITCNCVITGTSISNLWTKIDAIKAKLYTNETKALIFDYLSTRRYLARLTEFGAASFLGTTGAEFTLTFIAPMGIAEATSATTQTVTVDETPESFNVPASSVVAGTAYAHPVWTYTAAGSVTSLTLANTTTSESVTWAGTLASGHMLRFDAERMIVEKSTDSGTSWTADMSGVNSGVFPTLQPAVANACTLTGATAGSLGISYRARYL